MPKDTYFNLPEEKRNIIFDVAVKEFYEKGYDLANITHIVEKAKIAKGSFYQYFEGKEDLFRHVLFTTSEKKILYANPVIDSFDQLNFFDWFKQMLMMSLEFLKRYPDLAKISEDFWRHSNPRLKELILGEEMSRTQAFLTRFIEKGIQRNELTNDVPIELLTSFFSGHLANFTDYLTEKYHNLIDVSQEEFEQIVDSFVRLIHHGVHK